MLYWSMESLQKVGLFVIVYNDPLFLAASSCDPMMDFDGFIGTDSELRS